LSSKAIPLLKVILSLKPLILLGFVGDFRLPKTARSGTITLTFSQPHESPVASLFEAQILRGRSSLSRQL
jgi:hypothetical protein